jgi:hypothetical protein
VGGGVHLDAVFTALDGHDAERIMALVAVVRSPSPGSGPASRP